MDDSVFKEENKDLLYSSGNQMPSKKSTIRRFGTAQTSIFDDICKLQALI